MPQARAFLISLDNCARELIVCPWGAVSLAAPVFPGPQLWRILVHLFLRFVKDHDTQRFPMALPGVLPSSVHLMGKAWGLF